MPTKKVRNVARRPLPEKSVSRTFPFWTVFAILLLYAGVFIIGSVDYLLYNQQNDILSDLVTLNSGFTQVSSQESPYQFKETPVKGLFLYYRGCKSSFTGACDDAQVYRLAADGSKQVIIPSVRALAGVPLGSELLQPIEQSPDAMYIVFGAWAYGSSRNPKDTRVWIYDTQAGRIVAQTNVPQDAVYSPDYAHAAYGILNNGDVREIAVLNIKDGKTSTVAKAAADMTFMGPGNIEPMLVWKDAKTLFVNQYPKHGFGRPLDVENEQIKITIQ
jgi:hypothetical protein